MFKKRSKKSKHIALQVTIVIIVAFFWVIPAVNGPTPAEIVKPGLDNTIDFMILLNKFLIRAKQIFTTSAAASVTIIGGAASIAAAIWAFKKK